MKSCNGIETENQGILHVLAQYTQYSVTVHYQSCRPASQSRLTLTVDVNAHKFQHLRKVLASVGTSYKLNVCCSSIGSCCQLVLLLDAVDFGTGFATFHSGLPGSCDVPYNYFYMWEKPMRPKKETALLPVTSK